MKKKKKVIVDIDNTLWHFCDMLYERLRTINGATPHPDTWFEWDFWEEYCTKEEFIWAIRDIQLNQDDERHLPYPEAKDFLATLKEQGFHIVIASHRTPESIEQTHRWLVKHGLAFDEVHLSYDKTVLFDQNCDIVVDDSPHILEKATDKGIIATGLLFPWNKLYSENGYILFNSLDNILRFILDQPHRTV